MQPSNFTRWVKLKEWCCSTKIVTMRLFFLFDWKVTAANENRSGEWRQGHLDNGNMVDGDKAMKTVGREPRLDISGGYYFQRDLFEFLVGGRRVKLPRYRREPQDNDIPWCLFVTEIPKPNISFGFAFCKDRRGAHGSLNQSINDSLA